LINPNLEIDHVHLKVSNLEKLTHFYESILGFKIVRLESKIAFLSSSSSENKDSSRFLVVISELKDNVATNTWLGENISPAYTDNNNPGLDHYAINLHSRDDLFLLKNRLLEFKIDIDEKLIENDNQFSSSFYAYDFDGIKIQFLYNKR
jgi:catechol-2,3-dioxygenase